MAAETGGWQHGVAWSRMVAGMGEHPGVRVIDGRELKITTPGRVLYPATGTTKTDVLDYYVLRTMVAWAAQARTGGRGGFT